MLKLECRNIGTDCDYVASADSKLEVLDMVKTHMVEAHGKLLEDLTPEETEQFDEKLEALVREESDEIMLIEQDEDEEH